MFDFSSTATLGDWGITIGSGGGYGYGYPTGYPTGQTYPVTYGGVMPNGMNPQTQQMLFLGLIVLAVVLLTKR